MAVDHTEEGTEVDRGTAAPEVSAGTNEFAGQGVQGEAQGNERRCAHCVRATASFLETL